MTKPLALVFYERLLPGSQLVNRLQDIQYRVQTVTAVEGLQAAAEEVKPMVVFADLGGVKGRIQEAITRLKENPATQHLPIIGFAADSKKPAPAKPAPAALAELPGVMQVGDAALLSYLPQLLDQAMQLD